MAALPANCCGILFVFTGVNFEQWTNSFCKNLVGLLLAVIVFNNALMANIGYKYLHLCYENSYAEAADMVTEYRRLSSNDEIDRIAVLGSRYEDVILHDIHPITGEPTPVAHINIFSDTIDQSLLFDSQHVYHYLRDTFQLDLEYVNRAERLTIFEMPQVQAMNVWPAEGSICVIDNILVIKLNDQWNG